MSRVISGYCQSSEVNTPKSTEVCDTDAMTVGPSRLLLSLLLAFARGTERWGTGFWAAWGLGLVLFLSACVLLASVPHLGLIPFM